MTSDCHRPVSEVGQVTSAFGGTPGADLNIPQNKPVMQGGSYREPVAAPKHEHRSPGANHRATLPLTARLWLSDMLFM